MMPEMIMPETALTGIPYPPLEEETVTFQRNLRGVAASPGVVEGICAVLSDLEGLKEINEGTILLYKTAGPELAPIIPKVRGLITEWGGILAMASRIAREYGIPAVVGIEGLMRGIHNGDYIRVNGSDGTVTVISQGL